MVNVLGRRKRFGSRHIQLGMWLASFLLLLAATPVWSAEPTFSASLDRNEIILGESVTLSLTFENGNPGGQPDLPALPNIQVGAAGRQEQMTVVNGALSRKVVFTYELTPTKEGSFTIPGFGIEFDGKRVASQPLHLKVSKSTVSTPDGQEIAYIKLVVPRNEIYLGEVMPVEIQCYFQQPATDFKLPQLTGDGFIVGKIPQEQQRQNPRQVGKYLVFRFSITVTPTKTGPLTLGPATWGLMALSGPVDFWGNYRNGRHLSLVSDAPTLQALALPTKDVPPSFSGAIGNFSLQSYEAGPTNVSVGDPITLKVRISGNGAFDTLTLPASQPEWREFKTYPGTSKFEPTDLLQTQGSKYFEQVITPQNADVREIPAFAFSYFDPNGKQFRTLSHAPIALTVRPTAATPQPTVFAANTPTQENQPPAQEIVHIKPQLGAVLANAKPLIHRPLFLVLQTIPPLIWFFSLLWRRRKENLARNPRLRRQREVARIVGDSLSELPLYAQAHEGDKFYATVFRILQEQLGERLDQPASAITEAVLEHLPGQVDSATMAVLRELFQICNQHRYAPTQTSREMASLIPKLQSAVDVLKKINIKPMSARSGTLQTAAVIALLIAAHSTRADDATSAFNQANSLYEQGKYSQAAVAYEKLLESGAISHVVYFNLGNAWFKAGQIGKAIAAFRQAQKLAPRDPDVLANLQFARNQLGNVSPALPGNRWTRPFAKLSLDEWTLIASLAVGLFFLNLAARQFSSAWKKTSGGLTIGGGCVAAVLLLGLGLSIQNELGTRSGVVVVDEAVVRRGPFEESQSAFTVRDGTELLILDKKQNWLQVIDSARHSGWVQEPQVARIQ